MLTNRTNVKLLTLVAMISVLAGCEHYKESYKPTTPMACDCDPLKEPVIKGDVLELPITVGVKPNGKGGFDFTYTGRYFDPDGNWNFTRGDAQERHVLMQFHLSDSVPAGLKFISPGEDAMYIVKKSSLERKTDSPTRSFDPQENVDKKGRPEFSDFKTSEDGRTLTVLNLNNDGAVYRYNLRFRLGDDLVVHDPDGDNDDWD